MTTTQNESQAKTVPTVGEREFVMERIFNAPRELVFRVWSEPKHLQQWWGPKGWTLPVCEIDFRPGGSWVSCMRGPEGTEDGWVHATYREIVVPERIVYANTFTDADGKPLDGMPQIVSTIEFIDLGDKTKVRDTEQFATKADLELAMSFGMVEGQNDSFARLDDYLRSAH
jgi:uncharacterized protein YndB with AHSA1/START domain